MRVDPRQQRALPVARDRKSPPGWNSIVRLTRNVGDDLRQAFVTHVLAYAAILVAFFLRAYRLADKNVWWDEGWSIWLSQQDLAWIALRTAADEHPPLHYWMLHFWNALAGTNALAGRFLSVAFGVLTIALIYQMGKRIGGTWLGLLAALFLATARFHIWWSQDIKNYTPSIFFAFVAVWFALTILEKPYPKAILGYALSAALAVLTHYLAALIVLALNLYALLVFLRQFQVSSGFFRHSSLRSPAPRSPRAVRGARLRGAGGRLSVLRPWIIANALALLFFSPWLVLYLQNAQAWSAAPAFDFGLFLKLVATVLPLGVTTNIENYAGLTIAFTTIAALGITSVMASNPQATQEIASASRELRGAPRPANYAGLFALIVLLPPILIYLLSLTPVSFFAPKIQARYLVILVPAYALLLMLGIATLRKFSIYLALAAALLVLAANAFVLNDYYAERRLRDEYATLVNTINSFARQGDLILLDTDQEWPTFLYYLRAPLEWMGAPNGKTMTDSDADWLVRRALNRHSAVWLVAIPDALATDPQTMLETRLSRELPKQFEQTLGDKRVTLFARQERDLTQVLQSNLYIQHPLPFIPFRNTVDPKQYQAQLIGFDLPVREVHSGDAIYVTTYWFAVATRGEMQLIDSMNQVVNSTSFDLSTGKDVRVVTALNIPADAAGAHAVRVSVSEQSVELTRVRVEPRTAMVSAGSIAHPVDFRLEDAIHLVGYELPITNYRAGEAVLVTLYWRADQAIAKNYVVFVHLLGPEFNAAQNNFLWGQVDRVPREGAYPTTAWRLNEIVTDPYRVPIAPNAPAGRYKVEVGMYDVVTGARLKLGDGSDKVIVAEIEIAR